MSTRTTFEDRLLGELKREIELREAEAEVGAGAGAEVEAGAEAEGEVRSPARRRFTPRRIAVAMAACAAAWLATVVVPGSPADSPAYAAELLADGSVSLTVKDRIGIEAQRELAEQVCPWGIQVELELSSVVRDSRGEPVVVEILAVDKEGDPKTIRKPVRAWTTVNLQRGNKLIFDNRALTRDEIKHYEVRPCDSAKPPTPDDT
ncbi:hypothetical protein ACFS5L_04270 [Streptomyces phyllanthi]|uniref:Uncharacterized protein n=1 Tax=Streptomyces phyllanthi TaxID=1803180 RepID=A0A5N8WAT9_9ACTN|nr:hypothetical protein [Streptomyces phyllanthi]MPY44429.1 hypothetical protein [Streptomyces phyllanthi]